MAKQSSFTKAFQQLNIEQSDFDMIIADEGARREIFECLMFCFDNVPSLAELSASLIQYITDYDFDYDGGPGSGNFGHAGVPGQLGGSAPCGVHNVPDKYFPEKDSWRRDINQGWNKERSLYLQEQGHSKETIKQLDTIITEHVQGKDVDSKLTEFASNNPELIADVASFELKAAEIRRELEIEQAEKNIAESKLHIKEIQNGEYDYLGDREYLEEAAKSQLELNEYLRKDLDNSIKLYRKGDYSATALSFSTDRNGVVLYPGTENEKFLYPDHEDTLSSLEKRAFCQ